MVESLGCSTQARIDDCEIEGVGRRVLLHLTKDALDFGLLAICGVRVSERRQILSGLEFGDREVRSACGEVFQAEVLPGEYEVRIQFGGSTRKLDCFFVPACHTESPSYAGFADPTETAE